MWRRVGRDQARFPAARKAGSSPVTTKLRINRRRTDLLQRTHRRVPEDRQIRRDREMGRLLADCPSLEWRARVKTKPFGSSTRKTITTSGNSSTTPAPIAADCSPPRINRRYKAQFRSNSRTGNKGTTASRDSALARAVWLPSQIRNNPISNNLE